MLDRSQWDSCTVAAKAYNRQGVCHVCNNVSGLKLLVCVA